LSVLIADGHEDAGESMACMLRLYGHDVTVVRCGSEALAAATVAAPDVLIVEPYLPGLDGWEVARRLRADDPGLVCMAVTGGGSAEDRRRSRAAGIDVHLLKPAEPEALVGILARAARTGRRRFQEI
jgi:CheY-like chemotaxis protein